jgi:hypothetical protein
MLSACAGAARDARPTPAMKVRPMACIDVVIREWFSRQSAGWRWLSRDGTKFIFAFYLAWVGTGCVRKMWLSSQGLTSSFAPSLFAAACASGEAVRSGLLALWIRWRFLKPSPCSPQRSPSSRCTSWGLDDNDPFVQVWMDCVSSSLSDVKQ